MNRTDTLPTSHQAAALAGFREAFYGCLDGWADALFELSDALLCAPTPVHSLPSLSLEPEFRRSHGSLYKALDRSGIDTETLRRALVDHRPPDWPAIFAVDASSWPRCDAETSPERGFYCHPSRHSAGQPIVAGWSDQWITQLGWAADSPTAPLDARRIPPDADTTAAAIAQVRDLAGLLGDDGPVPLFVFDAGYDPIGLSHGLADDRVAVLVRIRNDRVFYTDPAPAEPGRVGRTAPSRRPVLLRRCGHLAFPLRRADHRRCCLRQGRRAGLARSAPRLGRRGRWAGHDSPPIVRGCVIRVDVEHLPKPSGRARKALWLWWSGPGVGDLDVCWRAWLRRFDIEHTYRFAKNTLGWTTPALRTPEQADRWTWLVVAVYTQLRLARGLVDDHRLPWERPCDPAKLTPARVRRGFRRLGVIIGTPANPPKSDIPGPGRPKGTQRPPRTRYPAIKKAA